MKNPLKTIWAGTTEVVTSKKDVITFAFFSLGIWLLFVMVPVWTTPGNDVWFQLSIIRPGTHVLMIVLALLNGLLLTMHGYIRRHHRTKIGMKSATHSLGSLAGSLVATLGCASCYSSILSVFGVGTVSFFGEYRWLISSIAIVITISAVYLTANRIENGCKVCHA